MRILQERIEGMLKHGESLHASLDETVKRKSSQKSVRFSTSNAPLTTKYTFYSTSLIFIVHPIEKCLQAQQEYHQMQ